MQHPSFWRSISKAWQHPQGAGCAAQRSSLLVTTSTDFIEITESLMQRGSQRYFRKNNVSVNTVERPC